MALSFVMCLCSRACLCVSVMLGAGMCRCSGLLRSRRAQKKKKKKKKIDQEGGSSRGRPSIAPRLVEPCDHL